MSGPARLVVTEGGERHQSMPDLVMAWARDALTGEPRYILELDEAHRGAKCGCECPSCGKPVTAVNAAKAEFVRRPHFRHPEGAPREACLVLAARFAALRQLQREGWIDLPRRRVSARVVGLSGQFYEAWVERAPARSRIVDVDYCDRGTAVISLGDGRKLRVELTGTLGGPDQIAHDGKLVPTIYLAIADPALAALAPEELRRRMRLESSEICWRAHWDDEDLRAQAAAAAAERAHFYFDDCADPLGLPEGLEPALRRETLLHLEVKRILEEVARITVPEAVVEVALPAIDGEVLRGRWSDAQTSLRLSRVQLETRHGSLIPDVICEAFDLNGNPRHLPLLIEVTVTNHIDDERLDRIRTTGEATLEIDLSLAGGRVNREELRRLVVDEVATKRWLFHPESERHRADLLGRLTKQAVDERAQLDAQSRWLAERRARVLKMPIAEIASEYLDAVIRMFDSRGEPGTARSANEAVADAADKFRVHGFPEASDENLIGSGGVLARVLSIKLGRPIGYRCEDLMSVLSIIRQTSGSRKSMLTVYLIACRAYPPQMSKQQLEWVEDWASTVRQSIQAGDTTYLRDSAFDRFLSLLFPEMAAGLAKQFGKLAASTGVRWDEGRGMFVRPERLERRPAAFLESQPRSDRAGRRLLDTKPGEWWLKGRDLEAWKRAHPEAAKAWFPEVDAKGS